MGITEWSSFLDRSTYKDSKKIICRFPGFLPISMDFESSKVFLGYYRPLRQIGCGPSA
jgi:hypothetical protein